MYSLLDLVIMIALICYAIVHKAKNVWLILTILLYVPNNILIILVMTNDTINTRYFYMKWLRFKLVLFCFWLPFFALVFDQAIMSAAFCSHYLKEFNMSEQEMQAVIDDRNFTLLIENNN